MNPEKGLDAAPGYNPPMGKLSIVIGIWRVRQRTSIGCMHCRALLILTMRLHGGIRMVPAPLEPQCRIHGIVILGRSMLQAA